MSENTNAYKLQSYNRIRPLGTKGAIWLVSDSVTGEKFVMRILSADSYQVYRKLARLRHPNLVRVADVILSQGKLYVIEEYLEWQLLSSQIPEKGTSGRYALSVGKQILGALCVLHQNNIIHRDIKPENIMVDGQGNARLIDFDIARIFMAEKDSDTRAKGSRDYAPPEQYGFAQSDGRADLYALGVTLNEVATGGMPWEKPCKGKLGKIVWRCTQLDPKKRFQSAAQVLSYIQRTRIKRIALVLAGTAVLGLAAAAAVLLPAKPSSSTAGHAAGVKERDEKTEPKKNVSSEAATTFEPEGDISPEQEEEQPAAEELERIPEEEEIRTAAAEEMPKYFSEEGEFTFFNGTGGIFTSDLDKLIPSLMMTEDRTYQQFKAEPRKGLKITGVAKKKGTQMVLSLTMPDGEMVKFVFHDVYQKKYMSKYDHNVYWEDDKVGDMPVDYQIVYYDFDKDGDKEFLVVLARRDQSVGFRHEEYGAKYCFSYMVDAVSDDKFECSDEIFIPSWFGVRLAENEYFYDFYFHNYYWWNGKEWDMQP